MRSLFFLGLAVVLLGIGCDGTTPPFEAQLNPVPSTPAPTVSAPTAPTSAPTPKTIPSTPGVIRPTPQPTPKKVTMPLTKTVYVEINDSAFAPQIIAINVGDTVVWINKGQKNHSSIGGVGAILWNSGNLNPEESYRRTFAAEGRNEYRSGTEAGAAPPWIPAGSGPSRSAHGR